MGCCGVEADPSRDPERQPEVQEGEGEDDGQRRGGPLEPLTEPLNVLGYLSVAPSVNRNSYS